MWSNSIILQVRKQTLKAQVIWLVQWESEDLCPCPRFFVGFADTVPSQLEGTFGFQRTLSLLEDFFHSLERYRNVLILSFLPSTQNLSVTCFSCTQNTLLGEIMLVVTLFSFHRSLISGHYLIFLCSEHVCFLQAKTPWLKLLSAHSHFLLPTHPPTFFRNELKLREKVCLLFEE